MFSCEDISEFLNYLLLNLDSWLTSLPVVTVSPEVVSNFVSKETVVLSLTGSSLEGSEDKKEGTEESRVPSPEIESSSSEKETQPSLLKAPPLSDVCQLSSDEVDIGHAQSDQVSARVTTPLKCCRRPFNGHTFSVSPNQVVNITSLGNLSKFSVRHLVNEFESHSSRNSLNIFPEATSPGSHTNSAMSDATNSASRKVPRRRSRDSHEPAEDQTSKPDSIQDPSLENDSSEKQVSDSPAEVIPNSDSVKPLAMDMSETRNGTDSSDSEAGVGCLTFLKAQHVSPIARIDRSTIEAASNTISKLIRSHQAKRSVDANRSREKLKDRGNRSKMRFSHPFSQLKDGSSDSRKQSEFKQTGNVTAVGNVNSGVFQKTGVVKQRLEAFEAKSVTPSEQQCNHRSHNRSHSASGSSSSSLNISSKDAAKDKLSMGHRRKSSMPHLNSCSLITDSSQSAPSLNLTSSTLFDRKGSLDSSNLFRTVPNANNRPFTVRGFQPMSSQPLSTKFPFAVGRHQRNSFGFNTSSTGTRQQHGSTHPLKLLPQTAKLSQQT